jgi:hypothetical protein
MLRVRRVSNFEAPAHDPINNLNVSSLIPLGKQNCSPRSNGPQIQCCNRFRLVPTLKMKLTLQPLVHFLGNLKHWHNERIEPKFTSLTNFID